jgi:hypothetical protein
VRFQLSTCLDKDPGNSVGTVIYDDGDLNLAERGGKKRKKRAIIATARNLTVLLHHLWIGGEVYEPLRD